MSNAGHAVEPRQGRPQKAARTPKLRLSCDRCATAKVKCSQEHPKCERCVVAGVECVYCPSQRNGKKPPRDQSLQASSSNDSSKASSIAGDIDQRQPSYRTLNAQQGIRYSGLQGFDPNHGFGITPDWRPVSGMPHTGAPLPNQPTTNGSGFFPETSFRTPFAVSGAMPSEFTPSVSNLSYDASQAWNFQGFLPDDAIRTGSASTQFTSQVPLREAMNRSGQANPSASVARNSCGGHQCYALACSTLASLHVQQPAPHSLFATSTSVGGWHHSGAPHSRPTSAGAPVGPSLDTILSRSRASIQNVLELLKCRCVTDPHMALLYASIVSKVLMWYKILAGIQDVPSASPEERIRRAIDPSSCSFDTSSGSDESVLAKDRINLGSFRPDEDNQTPVRLVALLGELAKVEFFIEALTNIRKVDSSNSIGEDTTDGLYTSLGSWLKSELALITEDVKARLHDPSTGLTSA